MPSVVSRQESRAWNWRDLLHEYEIKSLKIKEDILKCMFFISTSCMARINEMEGKDIDLS